MGSKVGNILKAVAPIGLSLLAPGLGTALGGALGAGASWAPIVGGGLLGAGTGALTGGGLKGALMSGLTGAVGGALNSSGVLGTSPSAPVSGVGPVSPGTGVLGSVGRTLNDVGLGSLTGAGGGGSSFGKLSNILGGINSINANDNAEEDLLAAQGKSLNALSPYLQSGAQSNARLSELLGLAGDPNAEGYGTLGTRFTAPDFEADPGYQFRKQEGLNALNQSLAAKGGLFSGAAGKAAEEYGQGLADQTYNDAYNRWRQSQMDIYNQYSGLSNSGQQAANSAAGIFDNMGNIQANSGVSNANVINRGLSSILGGSGAFGTNGQNLDQGTLDELLKKRLGA